MSLSGNETAIDDERCAGRESCGIGCQIENCCGYFLTYADAPDWNNRNDLVSQFVSGKAIEHFGSDDTRSNGVDADVLFGKLERGGFCQAFHRVLGSDVDAHLREANMSGYAGRVDDRAAAIFKHDGDFVAHRIENA